MLVLSGFLSLMFYVLGLYTSLTRSSFITSLSLLKSTGIGINLSISNLYTLLFQVFLIYQYLNYLHQVLSLLHQLFLAIFYVSTSVAVFRSVFVVLNKSIEINFSRKKFWFWKTFIHSYNVFSINPTIKRTVAAFPFNI